MRASDRLGSSNRSLYSALPAPIRPRVYSCWEHRKETIMLALFGVIEVATWMAHESPSQPRNQYGCTLNHL
jgi:hypothetical protein